MVDYDELLKLADEAFPEGTEYTDLLDGDIETAYKKSKLGHSVKYNCKAIEVGYGWVWIETTGWCKEFNLKQKHYELW